MMNNFDKKKASLEMEKWSIEMSSIYNHSLSMQQMDNNINKVSVILLQLRNLDKKRKLNKKLNKISDTK